MAADNEDKWPLQRPLLADPALKPTPDDIAFASAQARGEDAVVRQTEWDGAAGAVTVPGRTVAVLADPQG
jgi:hypothetical protein